MATVACSKCGAPLEPVMGARTVRCDYCNTVTSVPAAPAPQPVIVVNAPQGSHHAPRMAAHYAPTATAGASGCAGLITLVITAAVLLGVAAAVIVPLMSAGVIGAVPGLGWRGSDTLRCTGVAHESASGVTAELPGRLALEAGGNCELRLDAVTIRAGQGLVASGNTHVTIENSTLRTDEPIEISGNAHVELRNTTVVSAGPAFDLGGNGRVAIHGGRVEYSGQPYVQRANGRVTERGAVLVPHP